jgi:hypothetical protein
MKETSDHPEPQHMDVKIEEIKDSVQSSTLGENYNVVTRMISKYLLGSAVSAGDREDFEVSSMVQDYAVWS